MVEHSAVNRRVVGSSPTRGVKDENPERWDEPINQWLRGQAVKTSPFHGGYSSSNLDGVTVKSTEKCFFLYLFTDP